MLLKVSSGERCARRNFVLLATLGGTSVLLIVYLAVHHMKYIMERQMLKQIHVQLYPPGRPHRRGKSRNIDVPQVFSLLTLYRFHTFS